MRLTACIVAALLLVATSTHAAEPTPGSPTARVRVAFDRDGITSTRTEGYADPASKRAITVDDPVRIASISKLVLTIGVMRLVEEGKLDLDADVSKTLGWKLRNPAFPNDRITLRLLLSHTSSLTDGAGYWQVPLDGEFKELLGDPKAWDAQHAPGTYWRYANVGFPLIGAVMERATGERMDLLMQRLVLKPLDLRACYSWPSCDEATAARAVVLYREGKPIVDDNQGRKPACGITKARDGLRLLNPESIRAMIGPEWTLKDGNGLTIEEDDPIRATKGFTCRYGLAVHTLASGASDCGDDPFGDGVQRIGHSGNAYGLLAGLWVDRKAGTGVVYFSTGNDKPEPGEHSAFSRIEETSAAGW